MSLQRSVFTLAAFHRLLQYEKRIVLKAAFLAGGPHVCIECACFQFRLRFCVDRIVQAVDVVDVLKIDRIQIFNVGGILDRIEIGAERVIFFRHFARCDHIAEAMLLCRAVRIFQNRVRIGNVAFHDVVVIELISDKSDHRRQHAHKDDRRDRHFCFDAHSFFHVESSLPQTLLSCRPVFT